MSERIESGSGTAGGARFDSPLSLWIAIWQRQLVYGPAVSPDDPTAALPLASGRQLMGRWSPTFLSHPLRARAIPPGSRLIRNRQRCARRQRGSNNG
jgi:hypothetical protein